MIYNYLFNYKMQNTLTGNKDVDEQLILCLDYQDALNMCRTNFYASQLFKKSISIQHKIKQAPHNVNKIMNIVQEKEFILETHPYYTFEELEKILNFLEISYGPYKGYEGLVSDIKITPIQDTTLVEYYVVDVIAGTTGVSVAGYIIDDFHIILTEQQLREFLFIMYYNQIIL